MTSLETPGNCPTCHEEYAESGPCGTCGLEYADCGGYEAWWKQNPDADESPDEDPHPPVSFALGATLVAAGYDSCPRCTAA